MKIKRIDEMTIDEYKGKLISIVEDMEKEYGCKISEVTITGSGAYNNNWYGYKTYEVEIKI